MQVNQRIHKDPFIISNAFNDYYANVIETEVIPNIKLSDFDFDLPDTFTNNQVIKCCCKPISEMEVDQLISI